MIGRCEGTCVLALGGNGNGIYQEWIDWLFFFKKSCIILHGVWHKQQA